MNVNTHPSESYTNTQLVIAGKKPRLTYVVLILTVLVYLLQMASEVGLSVDIPAALGLKQNALILQGQVWRLITPVFLHGSILHLALNMYALVILGRSLEVIYGSGRFLTLYLIGGFAGNVVSFLFSPSPSLGSSTAIFALIAAEAVYVYQNRTYYGSRARPILMNILFVAMLNFIIGLSPGIDNWGHLGGFMAGLAFAWLGGPLLSANVHIQEGTRFIVLADVRPANQVVLAAVTVSIAFAVLAASGFFFATPR
jgi:rhomboid protease GluP